MLLPLLLAASRPGCERACPPPGFGPELLSVSPRAGPTQGGQRLKLEGMGLKSITAVHLQIHGGARKNPDKVPCEALHFVAANLLECVTGEAPREGVADVLLTHRCGDREPAASTLSCEATSVRYEFVAVTLGSILPTGGPPAGGTKIDVRGAGFGINQLKLSVLIGDRPCVSLHVESDERATCSSPATLPPSAASASAAADVTLPVALRVSLAGMAPVVAPTTAPKPINFTYQGPPVVASIAPDVGPVDGATEVTLRGAGLEDVTRVTLGGSNCINLQFTAAPRAAAAANGSEELRCVTTRAAAGTVAVEATGRRRGASSSGAGAPRYTFAVRPELRDLHPLSAPMAGGTVLRLEGARFGARAAELVGVTLGGLPCRTLTWDGSDAIGCTTPNLAGADGASSGSIDVRVVVGVPALPGAGAANRSIASNVAKLSVPLPPRLSSVVPASGPRAGGVVQRTSRDEMNRRDVQRHAPISDTKLIDLRSPLSRPSALQWTVTRVPQEREPDGRAAE